MTRAAYCPETINTIRANAKASASSIAAQLGWTVEELRRVAPNWQGEATPPCLPVKLEAAT